MDSIAQVKRYLPHDITTKIGSVKLYRETKDIGFVCRRYHISKASLMRWNKLYDGTKESLLPKSHRPVTQHPNAHTEEELKWIRDYHRRNPNISICELYGKLREDGCLNGSCRYRQNLYRCRARENGLWAVCTFCTYGIFTPKTGGLRYRRCSQTSAVKRRRSACLNACSEAILRRPTEAHQGG